MSYCCLSLPRIYEHRPLPLGLARKTLSPASLPCAACPCRKFFPPPRGVHCSCVAVRGCVQSAMCAVCCYAKPWLSFSCLPPESAPAPLPSDLHRYGIPGDLFRSDACPGDRMRFCLGNPSLEPWSTSFLAATRKTIPSGNKTSPIS